MGNDHIDTLQKFLETPGKELKKKADHTTGVQRTATSFISIPEELEFKAAGDVLYARAEQDETTVNRVETFECHPNDGLVNLTRIMRETFGWIGAKGIAGFFGKTPPAIIRVKTGPNTDEEVVAFGDIQHPQMPGVTITAEGDEKKMLFTLYVEAKQKHGPMINALFDELRARIASDSIYRGKAINSKFAFMSIGGWPEELILPKETEEQVWANIFTPLAHRDRLREVGIPFKRGVLLAGPYGTGKSLTANVAAGIAQAHGIAFLYVEPSDFAKLDTYLQYARRYAPAVVFFEDIDSAIHGTERDSGVNAILDTLDGVESKSGAAQDIMVVMTTNHVERLNPALLRPGRLDAVIHVGPPDAYSAGRLIRLYGRDTLAGDIDLALVGHACEGMPPAFIREVVERAKLHSLRRDPMAHPVLSTEDLIASAHGIEAQLDLAKPPQPEASVGDRLADAMGEVIKASAERATERGVLAITGGKFTDRTRRVLEMETANGKGVH